MSKAFQNGIHDISNEDYHENEAINRSRLMEFKRSPLHYKHKYLTDHSLSPLKSTEAMDFGNLVHCLVLEPHKFHENFVVRPDFNRRTNDGKFKYSQFISTLGGKVAVTQEDYDEASKLAESVFNHDASALLKDSLKEQSIFFTHSETNLQCKVRMDSMREIPENAALIIDLKTCEFADFRSIQNAAYKYGYFLQAGMTYLALKSINIFMSKFILICVEKKPPFAVGIFIMDDEAIDYGANQFNRLINSFYSCKENARWNYSEPQLLTVPNYSKYDGDLIEN